MSNLKIGIIGTGVMGAGHARFLRENVPGADVVAITDVDEKRAHELIKDLGGSIEFFSSAETLMARGGLDGLIIASPDALHVEHLRLAIKHKIPTLCEKPIATNIEDAEIITSEILEFEKSMNQPMIHFGFMRRFDPSYVKVKAMIESKDYGAPLFVRTITRNVSSFGITTEGLYTNIAVHDFDVWHWLLKDDWVSVSTHYPKPSSLSPDGLIDPLVFTATLSGGVLMVADIVANNNYGYDVRTEVLCERGSIEIGIFGDVITRANHLAQVPLGGTMVENWMPRFEDAYIQELIAWTAFLATKEINLDLATALDGLKATQACALGLASI